jgi:hypothetical protein
VSHDVGSAVALAVNERIQIADQGLVTDVIDRPPIAPR